MSEDTPFPAIAAELLQSVEAALPKLRSIGEPQASRPRAPGKWSPKQVIGHLIDSASNNHQRFVRAQEVSELRFPPYEQDHWVGCQHYGDRPWDELVTFWHSLRRSPGACHQPHPGRAASRAVHHRIRDGCDSRVPGVRLRRAPPSSSRSAGGDRDGCLGTIEGMTASVLISSEALRRTSDAPWLIPSGPNVRP